MTNVAAAIQRGNGSRQPSAREPAQPQPALVLAERFDAQTLRLPLPIASRLVSATSRNAACPCGSGRKFKRCCADSLGHARRVAEMHDAVGERMRAWAFEHESDAIRTALAEITAGRQDAVLGDADLALIACWALNDRELPRGGTLAQRYAQRPDLTVDETDVARRIAAAHLGLLRVVGGNPGRWIDLDDITGERQTRVMSHGVSRAVRTDEGSSLG